MHQLNYHNLFLKISIISLLYFISLKIFNALCLKKSKTSFSTSVSSLFKTPSLKKILTKAFKDKFNLEFTMILAIPKAALEVQMGLLNH